MIYIENIPNGINENLLQSVAKKVFLKLEQSFEVGLNFIDSDEMRHLNKKYRAKDAPTDVLSFNSSEVEMGGDIVICLSEAQKKHAGWNLSTKDLAAFLLLHGMLHLSGLDHETGLERANMEDIERKILKSFGILIEGEK